MLIVTFLVVKGSEMHKYSCSVDTGPPVVSFYPPATCFLNVSPESPSLVLVLMTTIDMII